MKLSRIILVFVFVGLSCSEDAIDDTAVIDFGEVTELFFRQNGNITTNKLHNPEQVFKFQINEYSSFDISINNFHGEFYLKNLTDQTALTHNGGFLGGGSRYLEFHNFYEFSIELFEGEYEFGIRADEFSAENQVGTYEITIENINDLRPYRDLGIIQLPHNELLVPFSERASPTIYEFELSESTTCHIFINGDLSSSSSDHMVKFIDELGIVLYEYGNGGHNILDLVSGKYKLTSRSDIVLILGDPITGDIDLGLLPSFPFSQEINLDFTYESDGLQKTYFETNTNVALSIEGTQYTIETLKTINGDNISDFNNISPGKYYLFIEPNVYAYAVNGNFDIYLYSAVQENFTVTFTEN